jgi:hypothetical protein
VISAEYIGPFIAMKYYTLFEPEIFVMGTVLLMPGANPTDITTTTPAL